MEDFGEGFGTACEGVCSADLLFPLGWDVSAAMAAGEGESHVLSTAQKRVGEAGYGSPLWGHLSSPDYLPPASLCETKSKLSCLSY